MYLNSLKNILIGVVCTIPLAISAPVYSSGFQTSFHSISSMSRALGGAGVQGDDLADIYYNPAGIRLYQGNGTWQAYSLVGSSIKNDFTNTGSTQNLGGITVPSRGVDEGIDEDVLGGSIQYIFPTKSGSPMTYGIFLGNAFGNMNEYSSNWVGRFNAINSEFRVIDINPTIGYDLNRRTTIGAGVSLQLSDATLSQAQFTGTQVDAVNTLDGDDEAFGFNVGIMKRFGDNRIGASYRSAVRHTLKGNLVTSGAGLNQSIAAQANITLPETVYLTGRFPLDEKQKYVLSWNSRWTRWSQNDEQRVTASATGQTLSVTPQNWDDSWLHGFGLDVQLNDKVTFRFGLAKDATPIPNAALRNARLPDADRDWYSFGVSIDRGNWVWDLGYQRQNIESSQINNTVPLVPGVPAAAFGDTLTGTYSKSTVDLYGIQVRYKLK